MGFDVCVARTNADALDDTGIALAPTTCPSEEAGVSA